MLLFKDQIKHLVNTKDGAHAACLLISYGTAKDRKAMVKSLKSIPEEEMIPKMSKHQDGHMVLIVICAVVDDTKLVFKGVLAQLKPLWHDLMFDKWGREIESRG